MNATGVTLSFQDLALVIAGLFALVGIVIWYVRDEARKEYAHKCEKERNDEQDVRLDKHDVEMKEFRTMIIRGQEVTNNIANEVAQVTKQTTKLLQNMHNWWKEDPRKADHS